MAVALWLLGLLRLYPHYFEIRIQIRVFVWPPPRQINQSFWRKQCWQLLLRWRRNCPRCRLVVVGILHFRVDQGDTYKVLRKSGLRGDAFRSRVRTFFWRHLRQLALSIVEFARSCMLVCRSHSHLRHNHIVLILSSSASSSSSSAEAASVPAALPSPPPQPPRQPPPSQPQPQQQKTTRKTVIMLALLLLPIMIDMFHSTWPFQLYNLSPFLRVCEHLDNAPILKPHLFWDSNSSLAGTRQLFFSGFHSPVCGCWRSHFILLESPIVLQSIHVESQFLNFCRFKSHRIQLHNPCMYIYIHIFWLYSKYHNHNPYR